ncbi:tetratricopeptide repeat protein [Spongiivirga sp. MCCC 1A20706]|uniref:tetratricopeptide repeat protein n=1 Tax=Spongiivirga sp. MCCC 1A20706 TaxID=3160963 RepID=UPI003977B0A9
MHYRSLLILLLLWTQGISGQDLQKSTDSITNNSSLTVTEKTHQLISLGTRCLEEKPTHSLHVGTIAFQKAVASNNLEQQAAAKLLMGQAYWSQRSLKSTLENLKDANSIYSQLNDSTGIANCAMNMGQVYAEIGEYDKAIELYVTAKTHFEKLDLKNLVATTYTKISNVLIERKDLKEAEKILKEALNIYDHNKNIQGVVDANNLLAKLFFIKKEYELADCYIEESIYHSSTAKDDAAMVRNLLLFSKILRNEKEYEIAEQHLDISLHLAKRKNLRKLQLEVLEEIKSLKKEEGKFEESIAYHEAYSTLKDSIYNTEQSKQVAELEFKDTLEKKETELNYMYLKKQDYVIIQWVLGIGMCVISLLAFLLIRSLRLKNKKQQQLHESNQRHSLSVIENQHLKRKELEQELHFKNKELTSYALNFLQKNEFLETLQDTIKEIKQASIKTKEFAFDQLEIIIKQQQNLDKNWNDFKIHFEQVHTNFLKNLKHQFPNLSANDLKVAALTRLNLTIKECSGILGISPESVKTARYRLRKKLDLDREDDLLSFLVKVEV